MQLKYKRISLKLSGEALGCGNCVLDFRAVDAIAAQIAQLTSAGVQVGVTLGGGNIWRGRDCGELDRNKADQMGMLSTVINSIAVADALRRMGVKCTVLSSVPMPTVCDSFTSERAIAALEDGHVVMFAAGSGLPFFSTDMAAALKAAEISADALLLAKNVDGVYTADPKVKADAEFLPRLTYDEAIVRNIRAMDTATITLCRDQNIPVRVFALQDEGNILSVCRGGDVGTTIEKQNSFSEI